MEAKFIIPQNYEQWLNAFTILSSASVSADSISELSQGSCPGIERVTYEFQDRLQDTTNKMLTRVTKRCTSAINYSLEEGELENVEVIMRRYLGEMKKCRFYLYINFLSKEFLQELDKQVTKEIERYWRELRGYLTKIVDETEDSRIYDIIYHLKRIKLC